MWIKLAVPYKYRIIWIVFTIAAVFFSCKYSSIILNAESSNLDVFSFIGTVATLIALIVTIFEILHSSKISRSISDEINDKISGIRSVNRASLLTEAAEMIDAVVDCISGDKYSEATIYVRELQKILMHSNDVLRTHLLANDLNLHEIERKIESYRHAASTSMPTKTQRNLIKTALSDLKSKIQTNNPGRG